ncbi:hypothetical protein GM661_07470 [Iocasia frigidifontis]|uniref:DUF2268 domain-containing protein n=1 Tax=Iocasia fonsfrigidae TaxID=2682810 RepID=A0A8A7KDY2_9FIRM|nr:DUF2268 domain-containing putative Zn-dependent protease [Iocasia fonsfrigidae]QTL97838.1 hypothetical protein GM661_07470 [Iocasia fonsfrigidae]
MLKFHWIYRDFIKANNICNDESMWVDSIIKIYFKVHWKLLNDIHFTPKGFSSKKEILSKIDQLGKCYYNNLLLELEKAEEFEDKIIELAENILNKFGEVVIDKDIYIIVGLGVSNIYSIEHTGQEITVICLESVKDDISKIRFLLSHECHHWLRQSLMKNNIFESCIGERLTTEGLASLFTAQLYPGFKTSEYCYVPQETVEWVVKNKVEIAEKIVDNLKYNDLSNPLFSRYPHKQINNNMPKRSGYVFGFLKAEEYSKRLGENAVELVGVKWEKMFSASS